MEGKKTVIIRVAYLVELTEEEIQTDDGMLEKITNEIGGDKSLLIHNKHIILDCNSTSCLVLDSRYSNCGKCSKCGQWTTNREKPDVVEGLCNGAIVDDMLLCDECLPHGHRWAF